MQYFIKLTKTKGFRLIARANRGLESETQTVVEDGSIDAINRQIELKIITTAEARKKAIAIARRYRKAALPLDSLKTITDENLKLLDIYWKKVGALKDNRWPYTAERRIKRALIALRGRDLATLQSHEIVELLNKNIPNVTTRRDAVAALRQLLKFLGKGDQYLPKPRKVRGEVRHVTMQQFRQLINFVDDEIERTVLWVGFSTGARLGEVFGISKVSDDLRAAWITTQMTIKKTSTTTKNGGERWSYVLPEGRDYLNLWIQTPDKEQYRLVRWAEVVRDACRKAGIPPIGYHDLRHSYAIHLIQKEHQTIEKVARFLGNSISVCQEFYTGFMGTLPDMAGMK